MEFHLLEENKGNQLTTGVYHRVHRGRDETGEVYLSSELERTLQLCT
jgi:hypothetical protein